MVRVPFTVPPENVLALFLIPVSLLVNRQVTTTYTPENFLYCVRANYIQIAGPGDLSVRPCRHLLP